jgi:hypothetical protein
MPAVSKKQQKFMQAVANNPKFAKKVGVKQSIGREFTKEKDMKKAVKKMRMGGMADREGRAMAAGRYANNPMLMADARGRAMMKKGGKVKKMRHGGNTSRMNELEELGRVDAEKGYTAKGKRNLRDEKKRVVREIKGKATGGVVGKLGKVANKVAKRAATKASPKMGKPKCLAAGGSIRDKEGRALAKNKRNMSAAKMADARGRAMKNGGATKKAKGKGTQGYNARLDESLGMRTGKASTKSQSYKSRRDESKGAKKAAGKRAYSGNRSSAQDVQHLNEQTVLLKKATHVVV